MILTERDVPVFPKSVTFTKAHVLDTRLKKKYPVNQVGYDMLNAVDGQNTIGDITKKIQSNYSVSYEQALGDVKSFFYQLNTANVLNIEHKSYKYNIKAALWNFRAFRIKTGFQALSINRRYDFRKESNDLGDQLLHLFICIANVFKYHLLQLFILVSFIPGWGFIESFIMTFGFFLSIVIHESSHIVTLYALKEADKLGYMTRSLGTIGVVRNYTEPNKEILISLSGPLIPVLTGIIFLSYGFLGENQLMVFLSFFFIAHLASFFSEDGKNIKQALMKKSVGGTRVDS